MATETGTGGELITKEMSPHDAAMARYRALDLQLDSNGVVQLTTDAARKVFAYGYHAEGASPKHLGGWRRVAEAIELIQGMGLPALSNLELVYEVGGKLTAMHRLCLAACQATGQLERHHVIYVNAKNEQLSEKNVVGFDVAACVVYVRRTGQEQDSIGAFTLKDAETAGLTGRNKNWTAYRKEMLYHRASMRALSPQFADVLQGVRCKELIEDLQPMVDDQGKSVVSADGQQLYQRSVSKQKQSLHAFEALKK